MNLLLAVFVAAICLGAVIAIGARLLTRHDQRRRAQADFARFMESVFLWSEQRTDLSSAQSAMEEVDAHKLRIHQIREATEQDLHLSRARRDYLEEYARLQRRHNVLVRRSKNSSEHDPARQDNTYLMALRFQDAVMSLTRGAQTRAG